MKNSRGDAETRRRLGGQISQRSFIFVDVVARLMDVHPSKPAEPLGPFGDMMLNSGGFFLPGCRRAVVGGSQV